jgi:hypothetical protein
MDLYELLWQDTGIYKPYYSEWIILGPLIFLYLKYMYISYK